jgi:hypothetical protein
MRKRLLAGIFFLLFSCSCQPASLTDFQYEGACQIRHLIEELEQIETREDLPRLEAAIKHRFEKIVTLMIQARIFQQKNPDVEAPFSIQNLLLSQSLLEEMKRVYALEGGKECIERAQREAMLKLDAQEKILEKQQTIRQ